MKLFLIRISNRALRAFSFYRKLSYLPIGRTNFNKLSPDNLILFNHDTAPLRRNTPITIGKINRKFTSMLYEPPHKTFVIKGKNWRVWGNRGAAITERNYLLSDVSKQFDDKHHLIFYQLKLAKPIYVEKKVALLAASGSVVYFHWMFDILPRIFILRQSGLFDEVDKFIINYFPKQYQTETLVRCGIDLTKIIPDNIWNFHLQAEELLVPSLVSPNDRPSLAACLYLRDLYRAEIETPGEQINIYIQRLNGRQILNEVEIISYLTTLNFQILNLETMPVAQQASLFARAKTVIGAHGAGFTNIVFCKPGTVILDLFSPEWINPCYWIISEHINLKYSYLIGEKIPAERNKGKGANIVVNLNDIKKLLKHFE